MSPGTSLVLAALIGALTSIAANAAWHYITSPRLVVHSPELTSTQGPAQFWGARVTMAEPAFVSRHPALAVQATLQVKDPTDGRVIDRKSTRLNSSHVSES